MAASTIIDVLLFRFMKRKETCRANVLTQIELMNSTRKAKKSSE